MRVLAYILFFMFYSFGSIAQTWQTIPKEHYNLPYYTAGNTVSINFSQFEINPYDGTLWFISNNYGVDFNIKRINADGSMTFFNPSNMPFMDINSRYFYGIDFTPNKTYILHGFDGLFSYDGTNWSQTMGMDRGRSISADQDTISVGRLNVDFLVIEDDIPTFYNWTYFMRTVSQNGYRWGSSSLFDGVSKYNNATGNVAFYIPDTCILLDYTNHDFKFARNSDTLYVAGVQGFSLAFGDVFVDTITMNNSPNMPYPSIIEFEFDSQDNIWAVFGDGGTQGFLPMYIAYYDRSVQDWTQIYDQSSCPVNFTQRLDIEIDPDDNLWVCDRQNLHVLKLNTTPGWLSLVEESKSDFSVYPNPSNGTITIETEVNVTDIEIRDLSGRLIREMKFASEINIEEKGTYFVRLLEHGTVIGTRKVIIE